MGRHKKHNKNGDDESKGGLNLGLSQETKNGIWGMVSFAIAVLATLAFFNEAGSAGELFNAVSGRLFGWGMFLVPVVFILLGIAFLKSIHRKIYSSALIGTLLFLLVFLGIFYIFGNGDSGARITQGGYLGVVLGAPLLSAFGFVAALVILVFLLFISILLVLNISLHTLLFSKREEEGVDGEDVRRMSDNIIIKRGSQILDQSSDAKALEDKKAMAVVKPRQDEEREFVIKLSKSGKWTLPPVDILHSDKDQPRAGDINANASIIKRTLAHFGIEVEMGEVSIGPTVTQFTLRPAVGIKLSRITALQSDLALALAAHPIRIEAPIPGKALVGIEVPNKKSALVGLRDLIDTEDFKKSHYFLPLAVGRDVAGFPIYAGLERMPHMLIAGATGTGKSIAINSILLSLLYKHSPDMLKLMLVDPKRVELSLYNGIPHLITPVITDTKKVINALRWAVREMEKRYERLSDRGARDIYSYNAKQGAVHRELMPFIIIIIDELADLMASHGRDVEAAIVRLAQMARAVGIHLIVSTQRPSVEVITGLIKANITSRMALQVASQVDSRTILDNAGAERLLGNGDMLYQSGDANAKVRRVQGAFVTETEVRDVVRFVAKQGEEFDELKEKSGAEATSSLSIPTDDVVSGARASDNEDAGDELFGEAKEVVVRAGKASASLLQRRLKVGYARAARLLDLLEERGIIGPGEGAKPRDVYVKPDMPYAHESSGGADAPPDDDMPELGPHRDDRTSAEE